MKDYGNEQVLVLSNDDLEYLLNKPDFTDLESYVDNLGHFKLRNDVETDPEYRQVIPYVLVRMKEPIDGVYEYLVAKRLKGVLAGGHTLGFGGHINPCDRVANMTQTKACIYRELTEELGIPKDKILKLEDTNSVIYNDENDVNRVHLGMIFIAEVEYADYKINEPENLELLNVSYNQLDQVPDLESWSEKTIELLGL